MVALAAHAAGITYQFVSYYGILKLFTSKFFSDLFFDRVAASSVFQFATTATIISMLVPSAVYGANMLSRKKYDNHGWGRTPGASIFLVTSIPLWLIVFVFLPGGVQLQNTAMSFNQYVYPCVLLGGLHCGINAYHVRRVVQAMESA